jgi:hypothetical protein
MEPDEFARSLITRAIGSEPGDFERWTELFARLQLRQVVYGALVARRFEAGIGDAQTRRVLGGPGTGPEGFDWLLKWFDWLRTPGRRSRVLAERPILAKDAHVDIHHSVENGQFVPQTFRLSNDLAPFKVKLDTDGWIVRVLTAFDGRKTVATAYEEGTESGWIPTQLAEPDFVDLVCQLAERGFLELADPQIS